MKPLTKKERKEQSRLMRRIIRRERVSAPKLRRYFELRHRDGFVPFVENRDNPPESAMSMKTCQYGSCLEEIAEKGVIVSLKVPTFDDEKRAGYCCAAHAAAALARLAMDRKELHADIPERWRVT